MHILFQGDSITDVDRMRPNMNKTELGMGYPHLVKGAMNSRFPLKHTFVNRGISGNRIVDLYARIKADTINLAPEFMSILIGVNDVWHEINYQNGVDAEKFEKIYLMYVEEIKAALPNIKLMIMEPFVLPGSNTTGELEDGTDKYTLFRAETEKRAAAARRVAEKIGAYFLPLQDMFDEACKEAPADYWLWDGVHPSEAGHQRIAERWMKAFDGITK